MSNTSEKLVKEDDPLSPNTSRVNKEKQRAVRPAPSDSTVSNYSEIGIFPVPGSFPPESDKGKERAEAQSPSPATTYAPFRTAATTFDMPSTCVAPPSDNSQSSDRLAASTNVASLSKTDAIADANTPTVNDATYHTKDDNEDANEDDNEDAAMPKELKYTYEAMEATGWASYHVDSESGTDNPEYEQSMREFLDDEPPLLERDDEPPREVMQTLKEFLAENPPPHPTDDKLPSKAPLRSSHKPKDLDIERTRAWSKRYETDPTLRKDEISPRAKPSPAAKARIISNPFRSKVGSSKLRKGMGWRNIQARMTFSGFGGKNSGRSAKDEETDHAVPNWKQESIANLWTSKQNRRDPQYNAFQTFVDDVAKQDESLPQLAEPIPRETSVATVVPCRSVNRRNAVPDLRNPQVSPLPVSNSTATFSTCTSYGAVIPSSQDASNCQTDFAASGISVPVTKTETKEESEAEPNCLSPAELEENTAAISSSLIKTLHKTVERQRSGLMRAEENVLRLREAIDHATDILMDTSRRQEALQAELDALVARERDGDVANGVRQSHDSTRSNQSTSRGGVRNFFRKRLGSFGQPPPSFSTPNFSRPLSFDNTADKEHTVVPGPRDRMRKEDRVNSTDAVKSLALSSDDGISGASQGGSRSTVTSTFVQVPRRSVSALAARGDLDGLERIQRLARDNIEILDNRIAEYAKSFRPVKEDQMKFWQYRDY